MAPHTFVCRKIMKGQQNRNNQEQKLYKKNVKGYPYFCSTAKNDDDDNIRYVAFDAMHEHGLE